MGVFNGDLFKTSSRGGRIFGLYDYLQWTLLSLIGVFSWQCSGVFYCTLFKSSLEWRQPESVAISVVGFSGRFVADWTIRAVLQAGTDKVLTRGAAKVLHTVGDGDGCGWRPGAAAEQTAEATPEVGSQRPAADLTANCMQGLLPPVCYRRAARYDMGIAIDI